MTARLIGLILLAGATRVWASSAPVVIVMPPGFEAQTDERARSLLTDLIGNSINKKGAAQIARFNADLADPGFPQKVGHIFACIGAEQTSADCAPAKVYSASSTEAEQQIRQSGAKRILLVRFQPMKTDQRLRLRAIVTDTRVTDGGLEPERVFTAVYNARVPADLEAANKKDAAMLAAWWKEGAPSRLTREVDRGLEELRQMLTLLDREVPADNSAPASWAQLPSTAPLLESGRVKCGGGGCKKHRVVRDSGERLWLTTEYAQGATLYGWSIVSMDETTAKTYSNIMLLVQTSDL